MLVPAHHGYGGAVFYYIGFTSHTLCLRWGRKREQPFVAWEFPDFMENGRGALVDQPVCCRPITPPTPSGDYAGFGHGLGHDGDRRFLHVPLSDPFGFESDALFLHFFFTRKFSYWRQVENPSPRIQMLTRSAVAVFAHLRCKIQQAICAVRG